MGHRSAICQLDQGHSGQSCDVLGACPNAQRRLLSLAIVGGAGDSLTASRLLAGGVVGLDGRHFGFTAPAWQILCAAAAICSVAATISTQMLKSNNIDERVARAEAVKARLEVSMSAGPLGS